MRNIMENRNKSGFTLIEIAIVVVIVAILIAGVMAGEEVLEGSKRMAVVSNLSKYKTAYDQFMEKYYSAPGDMSDAESVWG
jgi:prepilin-type N-terminal cleavage/methylation domain-containing protein